MMIHGAGSTSYPQADGVILSRKPRKDHVKKIEAECCSSCQKSLARVSGRGQRVTISCLNRDLFAGEQGGSSVIL